MIGWSTVEKILNEMLGELYYDQQRRYFRKIVQYMCERANVLLYEYKWRDRVLNFLLDRFSSSFFNFTRDDEICDPC
jgi:hypothetical protein